MSYCDDQYTKVAKPTATYTEVAKPAAPSYTVTAKPTASYTVIETPCLELLAIMTEDSIDLLHEDGRTMVVEGEL